MSERLPSSPSATGRANAGISVIIPVFNGEAFLGEAVTSILAQQAPVTEVIVVDDGSTDGSAAIALGFGGKVRCVRQENRGPAAARNSGLALAGESVIGFLDADDLWGEGGMDRQFQRLVGDSGIEIVKGLTRFIYPATGSNAPQDFRSREEPLYFWNLGGTLYRRTVFDRVGGLNEAMRFSEDLDWFNRARERGVRIELLEEVTQLHRRHAGNMTRGRDFRAVAGFDMIRMALQRRRKLQEP